MRTINEIIIHCSATPEGRDFTVSDIDRWHREMGFASIGYHFVVYRNGDIRVGRPVSQVGAHCRGHNLHSIGICYIGGLSADGQSPKDTRTARQRKALRSLVKQLQRAYSYRDSAGELVTPTLHGHNEFCSKACPSFRVPDDL